MKTLKLKEMELLDAGRDCAKAEGAVVGAAATSWVLGPIGFSIAVSFAFAYWMTQCGPSDY